jgi:tetratricopeptide (TPR) repeat protein
MVTPQKPPPLPPVNGRGRPSLPFGPDASRADSAHRPAVAADRGDSGFDRQLASLFGESVFGPWLDPGQYLGATRTTRRHSAPFRRLALLTAVLCLGAAAGWIVRAGLSRRTVEDREHVARNLASFLKQGELDRVAQFLVLLRGPNAPLDAHDAHLDLIIRAEAALYRYQDADPERLARIKPYLSSATTAPASGERILASLAVASRQERAARLALLESIRPAFDRDPEFHYLLATALEYLGDVKAARQAWDRGFELGPLWLAHRYEQAWFEARQGKAEAVSKLVGRLVLVAPESAWTRLASEQFAGARIAKPDVAPAAASEHPTPAVALYHQNLALAQAQVRAGDPIAGRRSLGQAIAAVNGQAPFVFDAFDWLVEAKAMGLARDLTAFETWPRHSELADARVARLAEPEHRPADNPPAVSESQATPKQQVKKPSRGKKAKTKAKARRRK